MPLIAMDWDEGGNVRWTGDGSGVRTARGLGALADRLTKPHAMICWTAFYSCDRRELAWVEREYLAPRGHAIVGLTGRAAQVLEAAAGGEAAADGVAELYRLAGAGSAGLDHRVTQRFERRAVSEAVDVGHAIALGGGIPLAAPLAAAVLGPYADLDAGLQLALGDGRDYCAPLLDALWRASRVSTSRDGFLRLLILTDAPATSRMARTVRQCYASRHPRGDLEESAPTLTLAAYRRSLRWAYGRIHAARMSAERRVRPEAA